jgi:hypothetical protein
MKKWLKDNNIEVEVRTKQKSESSGSSSGGDLKLASAGTAEGSTNLTLPSPTYSSASVSSPVTTPFGNEMSSSGSPGFSVKREEPHSTVCGVHCIHCDVFARSFSDCEEFSLFSPTELVYDFPLLVSLQRRRWASERSD